MTDDLELRKRIAEEARKGDAFPAAPGVRWFQFFAVPLLIIAACVGLFALVSVVTVRQPSPSDLLKDIRAGGVNARMHATLQLAQALRRMEEPGRSLTPELVSVYRSTGEGEQEDRIRQFLAACLGYVRDPAAAELLLEEARTRADVDTRASCLEALGRIADAGTLPDLLKFLDDENPVVRRFAALNAGRVAGPTKDARAVEPLREALADPVPDVTWNAAVALAFFLGDRAGVEVLERMLDRAHVEGVVGRDPEAADLVAHALVNACNAAAKLEEEALVPLLEARADPEREPDERVRHVAHYALREIRKAR